MRTLTATNTRKRRIEAAEILFSVINSKSQDTEIKRSVEDIKRKLKINNIKLQKECQTTETNNGA